MDMEVVIDGRRVGRLVDGAVEFEIPQVGDCPAVLRVTQSTDAVHVARRGQQDLDDDMATLLIGRLTSPGPTEQGAYAHSMAAGADLDQAVAQEMAPLYAAVSGSSSGIRPNESLLEAVKRLIARIDAPQEGKVEEPTPAKRGRKPKAEEQKPEPLPAGPPVPVAPVAEVRQVVLDAPSPAAQVVATPGVATRVEPLVEQADKGGWDDMDKIQSVLATLPANAPILQLSKSGKSVDSVLYRLLYGGAPTGQPQDLVDILDVEHLPAEVDRFMTIIAEAVKRDPLRFGPTLGVRLSAETIGSFRAQVATKFAEIAASQVAKS